MRTPEQRANFDHLCELVSQVDRRGGQIGFDNLSSAEKTLWLVWDLESEVNNGGFDQYFFNSSGDRAGEIVEALEQIGAVRCSAITTKAIAAFGPKGPATDRDARVEQLQALTKEESAELKALDGEFYAYPDPLESMLTAYTKANANQFL